jgi:hypothetical protein
MFHFIQRTQQAEGQMRTIEGELSGLQSIRGDVDRIDRLLTGISSLEMELENEQSLLGIECIFFLLHTLYCIM